MNKDELKNKIMGIISTTLLSKVMKEKYILKMVILKGLPMPLSRRG